jgi:hypothetical protein
VASLVLMLDRLQLPPLITWVASEIQTPSGINIVWGELNIFSIITLLGQFVVLIVFISRAAERAARAVVLSEKNRVAIEELQRRKAVTDAEATAMRSAIKDASDCAKACKDQVHILEAAFQVHRENVAKFYVTDEDLQRAEERIIRGQESLKEFMRELIANRRPV